MGLIYINTEKDTEALKSMVIGILSLFTHNAWILLDPRSTHSFIACNYVKCADFKPKPLEFFLSVYTPLGKIMKAELICKSCVLRFKDRELKEDLILLDM